jgi:uncharacterized protein YbgA (DUF1722 family)/uncharacterized protein YbbK (DUF523 family)
MAKSEATAASAAPTEIRIAVSACVLGHQVRFDGGHKLSRFLRDTFGTYVEYLPLCPEMDIGLGAPRETLRLVDDGDGGQARLVAPKSGSEYTRTMLAYARRKCAELAELDLQGAIVQKGSPSCGMERVRVYPEAGGQPAKRGRGLFTQVLMERFPFLPVEEDGRMNDPKLRENFVERVFAYRRLRDLFSKRWRLGDLVRFHTREKLLLLAHDRPTLSHLGRLVAGAKGRPRRELALEYEEVFMTGLRKIATRRKHTDVLQHAAGHLKKLVDTGDRAELHETIERYRQGELPLVVPITLLRHHVRRNGVEYLAGQSYLDPHPRELALRNHV